MGARVVRTDAAEPRARDLGLRRGRPVVALVGTTSPVEPDLAAALVPVLTEVLRDVGARGGAVVTGGTGAGVIALTGSALAAARPAPALVGVAPAGPVDAGTPVEAHHTVVALVPGASWGDETGALLALTADLARGRPSVAVVVGGGDVARAELRAHLRTGRPVVVVTGSGRLADEVAAGTTDDPETRALLETGDVVLVPAVPAVLRDTLDVLLGPPRRRTLRDRLPAAAALPRGRAPRASATSFLPPGARAQFPALASALSTVDEVVVPSWRACDATALREQNRHRWYVTLGLVGGFATTTAGALQSLLTSSTWPGVAVACLGAVTSGLLTVSRRQGALDRYVSARTRAERLRSLGFEYLSAGPAGWTPEAVRALREESTRRRYGLPAAPASSTQAAAERTPAETTGTPAPPWAAQMVELYRHHRLDEQSRWYDARARTFEAAARQTVTTSVVLLSLASAFGALGTAQDTRRAVWAVVATGCGALAAALNAYEAMSGFGRLARQYDESASALRLAEARSTVMTADDDAVRTFVLGAESIVLGEVGTWSVLLRQANDDDARGTPP